MDFKKYGKKHFNINYVENNDLKENYYDVIICHHVLEHIEQPIDFISNLRNSLVNNGLLVLHIPHQQPLTFKIRNWLYKSFYGSTETFCTLYSNIHISGFTHQSLKQFIEKQNFETIFIKSCGMWSKYYDPFFFMDMLKSKNYSGIIKKTIRHSVDNIGNNFELGAWIVGYFIKT